QEFEQRGCFTEAEIEGMLNSLLPVLQFVHDHRVIHRDIKPSNIIRKNDGTLVLIDFGSSHQSYVQLFNRQTPNTATPGYAPPEQLQGQVFPASDLFSLGLTALRLLTGSFPDNAGVDPLYDSQHNQWVWGNCLDNISERLAQVLTRLLQPQVALRYASAQAVLEDLATEVVCQVPLPTDELLDNITGPSSYARLQALLAAQRYQEADTETWQLLLQLANRTEQENLNLDAIEALPCAALETIDRLWWTYSQGRFGLRVQQQLYQSFGGTTEFNFQVWQAFAAQVGWFRNQRWSQANDLIYANTAPMGHLPACCMDAATRQGTEQGVCNWWRLGFVTLMERLETCHFARY
ncbi:MAG TPA: GUN4 domain-containing protein, partial [Stenomitos sp.]